MALTHDQIAFLNVFLAEAEGTTDAPAIAAFVAGLSLSTDEIEIKPMSPEDVTYLDDYWAEQGYSEALGRFVENDEEYKDAIRARFSIPADMIIKPKKDLDAFGDECYIGFDIFSNPTE